LSLDEYLTIPRKQSRMDEAQRREVYGIFQAYEKLKTESFYYDECDLIYNIAGRISSLDRNSIEIDSLFIDEVQDFTQAEIYILVKLCRNPNNLFLAGDTAQSITVGVDFRFTDVRQIFYNHFGGIEPKLLQLSHNYRSHSGVLRLAACVVELLYHFFGSSLDKLPPDLGLFSGPKPVIMDVANTQELVLMLQGAKRKTSRIEFGAHQVVIVRSEEAKRSLPEKFDIDKDWVMTVQESKGLEFDDVLLYDFFSDSPAEGKRDKHLVLAYHHVFFAK
jgi:superfamily I DNA/RNA helicase